MAGCLKLRLADLFELVYLKMVEHHRSSAVFTDARVCFSVMVEPVVKMFGQPF